METSPEYIVKQKKYGNGFEKDLNVSQQFVEEIADYLKKYNLFVRVEDDTYPFVNNLGQKIRLTDMQALNINKEETFYVEAKDHSRCMCYDITGQPQEYIETKMKTLNGGENVYMIFRENMEWVEKRAQFKRVSNDVIIQQLIAEGFAERRDDDSIHFIPYGHNLAFLLQEENLERGLEGKIKSNLSSYKGKDQYLWPIKIMLPIDRLIQDIII